MFYNNAVDSNQLVIVTDHGHIPEILGLPISWALFILKIQLQLDRFVHVLHVGFRLLEGV